MTTNADLITKARALGDDALAVPLLRQMADALEAAEAQVARLGAAAELAMLDPIRLLSPDNGQPLRIVDVPVRRRNQPSPDPRICNTKVH